MVSEPRKPRLSSAWPIGSVFRWTFGAGLVVLAYRAVTYQGFAGLRPMRLCHPSYVSGCPASTHVMHILAGQFTYVQVGTLALAALLGGALMLSAARGCWWTRILASLSVFAGVVIGWLLRWTLWGGLTILHVGDPDRTQRLASVATCVGLVTGVVVFLSILRRPHRTTSRPPRTLLHA